MGVHLNLSNESKLFMTIVLCSVIVLMAYTQTDLFTADPHSGAQSTQITFLSRLRPKLAEPESGKLLRNVYLPGFEKSTPDLCAENGTNVKVLIVVTSDPRHAHSRMAIRNTWGSSQPRHEDYVIAFIVGNHPDPVVTRLLAEESALYNDVIISRNVDSYRALTLKTASILEWASTFCRNALYILKSDDDMFINIPKLLRFLKSVSKSEKNIYGQLAVKYAPDRNSKSKYYISEKDFSGPAFPDFMTGPAYVMTSEVATVLYEAALNTTYLPLEDVFFTGVVAQRVGVARVAVRAFAHRVFSPRTEPCTLRNTITFHQVAVLDQFAILTHLRDAQNKTCLHDILEYD